MIHHRAQYESFACTFFLSWGCLFTLILFCLFALCELAEMIWICCAVSPRFEPGQWLCHSISKTGFCSSFVGICLKCAWIIYGLVYFYFSLFIVQGYRNIDKRGNAPHTSGWQGGSETNYIPKRFHYRTAGCKQITHIPHKLYWLGRSVKFCSICSQRNRNLLAAIVRCRADQRRELSEMASPCCTNRPSNYSLNNYALKGRHDSPRWSAKFMWSYN